MRTAARKKRDEVRCHAKHKLYFILSWHVYIEILVGGVEYRICWPQTYSSAAAHVIIIVICVHRTLKWRDLVCRAQ